MDEQRTRLLHAPREDKHLPKKKLGLRNLMMVGAADSQQNTSNLLHQFYGPIEFSIRKHHCCKFAQRDCDWLTFVGSVQTHLNRYTLLQKCSCLCAIPLSLKYSCQCV